MSEHPGVVFLQRFTDRMEAEHAELVAARKVVEAARKIDSIDTSDPVIGYETYYQRVTDIVRDALDNYDATRNATEEK